MLYARRRLINRHRAHHRHGRGRLRPVLADLRSCGRCSTTASAPSTSRIFTEMTPPPGQRRRPAQRHLRQHRADHRRHRSSARPSACWPAPISPNTARRARLAEIVRFINDILLSAPSIVVGLFIYEVLVVPMGHFSAWAGVVVLAVIAIPVIVRTTEDMLNLVPNGLREAASALGTPMWKVVVMIAYRAARNGIITGILLAIARVSGETAPLLFTALNNQFWSTDMNAPMASLPVTIFQFALSPYDDWQQPGLGRGADHHRHDPDPQHRRPRPCHAWARRKDDHEHRDARNRPRRITIEHPGRAQARASAPGGAGGEGQHPQPQLLLRPESGAEEHQPAALRQEGHRLHRSVGLRQVDPAARAEPHLRPLSQAAGDRRGPARRAEHPLAQAGSEPAARAHRHGVPEAHALSHVDLRQHRLRRPAL